MPRGDKSAYTAKQKRQAKHIEDSELKAGRSAKDAERIAWATVNKQDGGGQKKTNAIKKSTSPKQDADDKSSSKKTDTSKKSSMGKSKDSKDKKSAKKTK